MTMPDNFERAPLDISPEEFRALGHRLVDRMADFLASLPERPVSPGATVKVIREALSQRSLPEGGAEPGRLLEETAELLVRHSLFTGHPRFLGYIIGSPAPIGALADFLAASINPNVGAWILSPMASEIEAQTVQWIAELIGYPTPCGGLLVSGGNMANFIGVLAARRAKAPWDVRAKGLRSDEGRPLRLYASAETHTWIHKSADLFGLGTDSIRWIPTDARLRMDTAALRQQIEVDRSLGELPCVVVGTAGSVSFGAVDPLPEIAGLCREYGMWFHVDGAYGGIAAALPGASPDLRGLAEADSVAVDPHKWLYQPVEVGCVLVRDMKLLRDAFSYHPPYYKFDDASGEEPINYYEYSLQNSRGFRALKVWLSLQQAGREGYVHMIRKDVELARALYERVQHHPELEACLQNLSITTFRYLPPDLQPGPEGVDAYLNQLNTELLTHLQNGGEAFISNAVLKGKFLLRACFVNFRTSLADVAALPEIVVRLGRELNATLRPGYLKKQT